MTIRNPHALPLLCVALASLALFALIGPSIPVTVDETPYILAGRAYADWLLGGGATLDEAFAINHEHPPMAKTVYGLCARWFAFFGPLTAPRVGGLLFLLILQTSFYFLIAPRFGRLAATAGALAVIAHPRLAAHAFSCGLDMPAAAMSALCALLFVRGLERQASAVLCGVVWGLAMATKNNGLFVMVPLFVWALLFHRRRMIENAASMIVLGPLAFVAAWPWLWRHPLDRLFGYFQFNTRHAVEPTYFLGGVYATHRWCYPLTTVLAATPLLILGFAAVAFARLRKRPLDPTISLLALLALVALLVVMPPSVPVYNGDRLLLSTEIMLCGLAGIGAAVTAERLFTNEKRPRRRATIVALLGGVLLLPGLIDVAATHPYERSYYGALVGFGGGAMRLGFNPMEWSEVAPATVTALNRSFPEGLNLDNNSGAATVLKGCQQLGLLGPRFSFFDHAEYWLVEGNLAYSGFPRFWLLYYDLDPEYRLLRELDHHAHWASLYKRTTGPLRRPMAAMDTLAPPTKTRSEEGRKPASRRPSRSPTARCPIHVSASGSVRFPPRTAAAVRTARAPACPVPSRRRRAPRR